MCKIKDYCNDEMDALYKSLRATNKKVIMREIPAERRASGESLRNLEKGIAARIAENEAMLNRSMANAIKEDFENE